MTKRIFTISLSILFSIVSFAQENSQPSLILPGHTDDVDVIALSTNLLATGGHDFKINLYQADSPFTLIKTLGGHLGPITALAFTKDGKRLASAGEDRLIQLWDSTFTIGTRLEGHKDRVNCLAFERTGRYLFSGSDDKTILIWNIKTGKVVKTISNEQPINSIAISNNGKYIYVAGGEPKIKLIEIATGKTIKTFDGHTDVVNDLALTSDEKFLLSGSNDKTARVWNLATGKQARILPVDCWKALSIALSNNQKYAVTGCNDGSLKVWEWETGKLIHSIAYTIGLTRKALFNKDNTLVFAAYMLRDKSDFGLRVFNSNITKPIPPSQIKNEKIAADSLSKINKDSLPQNSKLPTKNKYAPNNKK